MEYKKPLCGENAPYRKVIDDIVRCRDGRGYCPFQVEIETPQGLPEPIMQQKYFKCVYEVIKT